MKLPKAIEDAKARIGAEAAKVGTFLSLIADSRWLMAVLAALALAFGLHALYAPDRLPTIGGLSLAQAGLPADLDFGVVGQQAQQAHDAAVRQDVSGQVNGLLAGQTALIPYLNLAGFGSALTLLLGNLWLMTKRRRYTRG